MVKRSFKFNKSALLLALIFALFVFSGCGNNNEHTEEPPDEKAIYKNIVSAAAEIRTTGSAGSGFIYKLENSTAYIVTNKHILSDSSGMIADYEPDVVLYGGDGKAVESKAGKLLGYSSYYDIAVVSVVPDSPEKYSALKVYGGTVTGGERVYAAANALDAGVGFYSGHVIKTHSLIEVDDGQDAKKTVPVLPVSLPVNPGASGCAVVNADGLAVGVGTYQSTSTGEASPKVRPVDDISYLVSAKLAAKIADEIIASNGSGALEASEAREIEFVRVTGETELRRPIIDFGPLGFTATASGDGLNVTRASLNSSIADGSLKVGDKITHLGGTSLYSKDVFDILSILMDYLPETAAGLSDTRLNLNYYNNEVKNGEVTFTRFYKKAA